jgi:hypothetical protein
LGFRWDLGFGIWVFACALLAWPAAVCANAESARLRARAYDLAYNLDYDAATREMEAAVKADPSDLRVLDLFLLCKVLLCIFMENLLI